MAYFSYLAKRGLQPNHNVGDSYAFEIGLNKADNRNKTIYSESVSLSGIRQSIVRRREKYLKIQTNYIADDTQVYADIYEFAESVDERESFIFSLYGSLLQPGATRSAMFNSNYTIQRLETSNEFSFSFDLLIR